MIRMIMITDFRDDIVEKTWLCTLEYCTGNESDNDSGEKIIEMKGNLSIRQPYICELRVLTTRYIAV